MWIEKIVNPIFTFKSERRRIFPLFKTVVCVSNQKYLVPFSPLSCLAKTPKLQAGNVYGMMIAAPMN